MSIGQNLCQIFSYFKQNNQTTKYNSTTIFLYWQNRSIDIGRIDAQSVGAITKKNYYRLNKTKGSILNVNKHLRIY